VNRLHIISAFLLAVSCAGLSGCFDEADTEVKDFVREVKARKAGKIDPLPVIKPYEKFIYTGFNARSPFDALGNEAAGKAETTQAQGTVSVSIAGPDPKRPHEALEAYSLDSLKMVGILEQKGEMWALIKDKAGTIYRVTIGNYLGLNDGKIDGITEKGIEITELVPDSQERWHERIVTVPFTEG